MAETNQIGALQKLHDEAAEGAAFVENQVMLQKAEAVKMLTHIGHLMKNPSTATPELTISVRTLAIVLKHILEGTVK